MRLLCSVDVDLLAQGGELVGVGELFHSLLEVRLAETDFDAVFLGGVCGIAVAVMALHTTYFGPDQV